MENESTLEALRRLSRPEINNVEEYAGKLQAAGRPFRDKIRDYMQAFEDRQTSDPSDTAIGPALAAGSATLRDLFIPEDAENKPMELYGAAGTTGKLKKALGPKFKVPGSTLKYTKNTKLDPSRPIRDAREAAVEAIANKPRTLENLKRIEQLDDKQSMAFFRKAFGGLDDTGITPSDARRYSKMYIEGKGKKALEEIEKIRKQPTIKRTVRRGLDE